ncbi:TetR/AcrR family transcriptional regulator [Castellaniella sp.]|uniref:TetR/AcrR family transcriptional regulator n=1 Tax=Castellaniella sp. TaxID=1955812 RepID=UPI00355EBD1E
MSEQKTAQRPVRKRAARKSREERVSEILRAARLAFSKSGYDSTSVGEIASSIHISESTIYKYFDSKNDLLYGLLRKWYLEMISETSKKATHIENIRYRIYTIIHEHLITIREAPDLCRLFYTNIRSKTDYIGSEFHILNRRATQILVQAVEDGMAEGLLDKVSPLLVRNLVYGGIEHHVTPFLAGKGSLDCADLAQTLTSIIFDGLGKPRLRNAPDRALTDEEMPELFVSIA